MTLVVDTSALAAVVFGEPDAELLAAVMTRHAGDICVSAATLVEASIVVIARQGDGARDDLEGLLQLVGAEVVPLDAQQHRVVVDAWRRFGKGRHPASLNIGDCFSYALARVTGSALLYKGDDFSQTDVRAAV